MSYRGPPTVTSIVLKYRETADILTLPFGVVVSGNKTVIQQLAGKQQLLRHITLVAATHEPALEWSLMLVRAADWPAHCPAWRQRATRWEPKYYGKCPRIIG